MEKTTDDVHQTLIKYDSATHCPEEGSVTEVSLKYKLDDTSGKTVCEL